MDASIVAAVAALAGGVVSFALQQWAAARTDRAARAAQVREAARALLKAAAVHRRGLYTRWELRDTDLVRQDAARWESWASRTDVTDARDNLRMATRDAQLLRLADHLISRSYALRDATTPNDVQQRGDEARDAHDALVAAVAEHVIGIGSPLPSPPVPHRR